MFNLIGITGVLVILFALCKTQDKAMDAERKFWIEAGEVFENH